MKVAIVGGGFTGCSTALLLHQAGHEVTLYDSAPNLGGSLRETQFGHDFWLNGCQYLAQSHPSIDAIRSLVSTPFLEFEHTYASLTELGDSSAFRTDIALPVIDASPPNLIQTDDLHDHQSMRERFKRYGPLVASHLNLIAERCGHSTDYLSSRSAHGLQMSAVMFQNSMEHTRSAKENSSLADTMLALPRNHRGQSRTLRAMIPSYGYNRFFDELGLALKRLGINIFLKTGITPRFDSSTKSMVACRGRAPLDVDLTVWCGNPVPLLASAGLGKMDSPKSYFKHLYCTVSGVDVPSPTYVQCYSASSSVYRVYVYPSDRGPKACVELYPKPEQAEAGALYDAQRVISLLLPAAKLKWKHSSIQESYFLSTLSDLNNIGRYCSSPYSKTIAYGGWDVFGRMAKVEAILSKLTDKGGVLEN